MNVPRFPSTIFHSLSLTLSLVSSSVMLFAPRVFIFSLLIQLNMITALYSDVCCHLDMALPFVMNNFTTFILSTPPYIYTYKIPHMLPFIKPYSSIVECCTKWITMLYQLSLSLSRSLTVTTLTYTHIHIITRSAVATAATAKTWEEKGITLI